MAGLSRYLARRAVTMIPTIFGVVLITFIIAYIIPADLARAWAGGEKADPRLAAILAEKYHLNDPWYYQLYWMLRGILTNTLDSPLRGEPVMTIILRRFHVTAQLAILTIFIGVILGFPMGLIAALKRDSPIDTAVRAWALTGASMPSFWFAVLMIWVFFTRLHWTYLSGDYTTSVVITGLPLIDSLLIGDFETFYKIIYRYWLPSFVLGVLYAGTYARYLRNALLDVLGSEFMLFLQAKGVPKWWMWKHALRHSMITMVTIVGYSFAGLLGGAVITETVFNLPGIGRLALEAIYNLDFPILIGVTLFFAIIVVLASLIIDILYSVIDPRVRY